jgi:Asp-tRNA(Asn)/Glu-tRNA(Gln) amidotransferase C subunit
LDTEAIPPTATVLPLRSVMRDDVITASAPPALLLANAPKATGDSFEVPVVLE